MKRLLACLVPALALLAACNSDSSGPEVEKPRTAEASLALRPWNLSDPAYRNAVRNSFAGLPVAAGAPITANEGVQMLAAFAAVDSRMNPGRIPELMDTTRAFQRFRSTDPAIGQVGDSLSYAGLRTALVGAMSYEGGAELEKWVLGARSPAGGLMLAGMIFSSTLPETVPAQMTVLANGRLLLRVNARLMYENPLRLIPLIAHEIAAHQDGQNSRAEEVAGSLLEQMIWYHMLTAQESLAEGGTVLPVTRNLRLSAFLQSGTGSSLGLTAANGSLFPDMEADHPLGATRSFVQFVQTQYPGATAAASPSSVSLTSFLAALGLQCPATEFSEAHLTCLHAELGRISSGQMNGFAYDRRIAVMSALRMAPGQGGGGPVTPR
ncbi:MAG TPA: hypothetical protein VF665_04065 [Longimicrobium sp.]|jgi:hypothetical protein|uniref:hypothetical protein n=1 Tax=Longimicrobium sp. TaxID=2029185 RepID=UPI002ED89938